MQITIVNQYYEPDLAPTAKLAASLARHRAARGDAVTVITSGSSYAKKIEATATDGTDNPRIIRVTGSRSTAHNLTARLSQYSAFYLGAAWQLQRLRPQDVIISMTTPPYIAQPCVWHKRRGRHTKVVLWNMDCYPDILEVVGLIKPGGWRAKALNRLNRRLFRQLDHIVCLDEAMRNRLRPHAPLHLPITIIPNWEPLASFPETESSVTSRKHWRGLSELGLSGRFVLLYMGNAGWGHEFETVLEAAAALREEPIVFLFVGGGSKHQELRRLARIRGLSNVRFHPYVPEAERQSALASADLALATLSDEAIGAMSPSKVHANLAMSIPVVYVGPVGSNVDQAITVFDCGLSVRHGQSQAIACFVRNVLSDATALHRLRRNARTAFERAYCDAVTLPAFDEVIASLQLAPSPP